MLSIVVPCLCCAPSCRAVAVHIDALPSLCGAVQCSSLPSLFCASRRSAVALLALALICHAIALLCRAVAVPCYAMPLLSRSVPRLCIARPGFALQCPCIPGLCLPTPLRFRMPHQTRRGIFLTYSSVSGMSIASTFFAASRFALAASRAFRSAMIRAARLPCSLLPASLYCPCASS